MWEHWVRTNGPMGEILDRVPDIARGREPVLILGEEGSGRSALA